MDSQIKTFQTFLDEMGFNKKVHEIEIEDLNYEFVSKHATWIFTVGKNGVPIFDWFSHLLQ